MLLSETRFDKRFGIKTTGFKRSKNEGAHHYQGAAYSVILPLIKEVHRYCPNHQFYDIGSGMGRVLFVAEQSGFSELTGIEMNKALFERSEQNKANYSKKNPNSMFRMCMENALEHEYKDVPSVYFLFNPFDSETLGKFIDRVCSKNKREKFFVYMNPVYREEFNKRNILPARTVKTFLYTEAILYRVSE